VTQDEIDIMWQQAMQESIKDGEMFTRYHFAKLVAERALKEHAMQEVQRLGQEIEQEPVAWLLTDKNINSLQVDSIQRLINRLNHAHHTDLCVRINGQDEWFQADWLKHMVRATPPQRTEQEPDDIASIIACRNILDAQPVPPRRTEGKSK
jgi:hypothetical protein